MRRLCFAAALVLLPLTLAPYATAQTAGKDWIGTWAASPMYPATPLKLPLGRQDLTLRQVVHISQGGKRMRITLTNEFGKEPLHIAAAHVAFLAAGSRILPATDKPITFHGKPDVTIPAGQFLSSDPIVEPVPVFSDLVISMLVPAQPLSQVTYHPLARATTFLAAGDQTTAVEYNTPAAVPPGISPPDVTAPVRSLSQSTNPAQEPVVRPAPSQPASPGNGPDLLAQSTSWFFLKDIQVNRERHSAAIVTFGDSITDGAQSTPETNRRYPDVLAARLTSDPNAGAFKTIKTAEFSVLNEGISGNRVLNFGSGPSALDRFDRDVAAQPGAKFVILLEGINDIGNMHRAPADAITEQQLIDAYTQLAKRAHAAHLKIFAATLLPYTGAKYYNPDGELIREHVNTFLRTSPIFDGVIDFERAIADPADPSHFLAKYDSGDHLHPSDAGYAAMANAVDLKLFTKTRK